MWTRNEFTQRILPRAIGMVHLLPLPGAPRWQGNWAQVLDAACADAQALADGGLTALMIENYHDVPFYPEKVPPETIAALTMAVAEIRRNHPDLQVGVNVLRNDVEAALAIALATGAHFVRVNVHTGATVTDQGPMTGQAWHTLRRRRDLGAEHIGILADVRVKHARPLVERPLAEEAQDLRLRGLADAVIVTGAATGFGASVDDVKCVRQALPDCPILVGSGLTAQTVAELMTHADGCIVGTSLQAPDPKTGRKLVSAALTQTFLAALAAADAES